MRRFAAVTLITGAFVTAISTAYAFQAGMSAGAVDNEVRQRLSNGESLAAIAQDAQGAGVSASVLTSSLIVNGANPTAVVTALVQIGLPAAAVISAAVANGAPVQAVITAAISSLTANGVSPASVVASLVQAGVSATDVVAAATASGAPSRAVITAAISAGADPTAILSVTAAGPATPNTPAAVTPVVAPASTFGQSPASTLSGGGRISVSPS